MPLKESTLQGSALNMSMAANLQADGAASLHLAIAPTESFAVTNVCI